MNQIPYDVNKIDASGPIQGLGRRGSDGKERKQGRPAAPKKGASRYLNALSKAVEASNKVCAKKALPYRFRVYLENNNLYIDLLTLDNSGNIIEEKRKNVTEADFSRLIDDVSNIAGLFFDGTA
jgi:hypothetical protein